MIIFLFIFFILIIFFRFLIFIMSNFISNIGVNDVLSQKESVEFKKKGNTFDLKNYLQAKLSGDETTKTLVIRLLPFSPEGGTPFHKVWMHMIKVNKEVSASGWKSFPCPTHNHLGDDCPFCDVAANAREKAKTVNDEAIKKTINDVEFMNRSKENWVVRCIERGHEDDGVKFWLFPHSKKNDGIYNKIMNKFQNRYETAKLKGKECNIFDLNNGRDLIVTLTKTSDGKTSVDIDVDDEETPLTTDYEKGISWVNDSKKWNDVFTVKNTDYMRIIATNGVPVFDKVQQKYVNKNDLPKQADMEKVNHLSEVAKQFEEDEGESVFTKINTDVKTPNVAVNQNIDEGDDLPF